MIGALSSSKVNNTESEFYCVCDSVSLPTFTGIELNPTGSGSRLCCHKILMVSERSSYGSYLEDNRTRMH